MPERVSALSRRRSGCRRTSADWLARVPRVNGQVAKTSGPVPFHHRGQVRPRAPAPAERPLIHMNLLMSRRHIRHMNWTRRHRRRWPSRRRPWSPYRQPAPVQAHERPPR